MLSHGGLMMWMCHYLHICNFIVGGDNFCIAFSQIGDIYEAVCLKTFGYWH